MKGTEIGTFENINVQWVGGATPTAYFQNDKGETISETEIGDKSYEDLLLLFQEHHFTPKKKVYTYPESFSDVSEFGGHRYELFNSLNYFDAALEFAKSKNFNGKNVFFFNFLVFSKTFCSQVNKVIWSLLKVLKKMKLFIFY